MPHGRYGDHVSERRKIYSDEAAELVDVAPSTWRRYCSDTPGRRRIAPEPDGTDIERGHARPYWWPETIEQFKANRVGKGHRSDLR